VRTVTEPVVRVRPLTAGQVADLIARLQVAVSTAEGLKGIHAVYAAEANAYRRVLQTLGDL
jgi:hypothetical protein